MLSDNVCMKKKILIIGFLIGVIIGMGKIQNLTPKFDIPSAEKELQLEIGQVPMGDRQGGLSLFSTKFKRGYGDQVFGSDENGIWLGAAEFSDAPFNVDMDGSLVAKEAIFKNGNDETIVDATGLVSSTTFASDSAEGSLLSTSSTSYSDISGTSMDITLTRSARVLFIYSAKISGQSPDGGDYGTMCLSVGGVDDTGPTITNSGYEHTGGVIATTGAVATIQTLPSGTTTVKLRGKSSSAGQTAKFFTPILTYVILGT